MPKQTPDSAQTADSEPAEGTVTNPDGGTSIEDRIARLEEAVFVFLKDVLAYHTPRGATAPEAVEPKD